MSPLLNKVLKTFNSEQLSAVQTLDGPLLISAGAGSGKTRVLTYRIVLMMEEKKIHPLNILAVTFTNKAANEMQERVTGIAQKLNIPIKGRMWISTFHAMCARILRESDLLLPSLDKKRSTFTIYDNRDQLSLVKKIMKSMNINEKIYNPKILAGQIALCKRRGLDPEDIDANQFPIHGIRFQEFYFKYEEELHAAGAFDFEGLLFETYKLFIKYPEHLKNYQKQFQYISVDEYQDTNHIQYSIIKLLAEKHRNICVVGDEDQSIYSWRGADISNILNFDRDFPECKIVKLEENYRSTKNIISTASSLISHNLLRKDKTLFTNNPEGNLIYLHELEDEYKEAHLIANIITSSCEETGCSYDDFAIFYRTNAQSRVLEDSLRSRNIPYRIIGNLKFYDRAEIKDALAYLKFIANSQDEVSLNRILNSPKRGIGAMTVKTIAEEARHMEKNFYEAMKYLYETNQIKAQAKPGVREFIEAIEYLKKIKNDLSLSDFCKEVLERTKYLKSLSADKSIEALSRLENLQEFRNMVVQFEMENEKSSLEFFLEEMALLSPSDQNANEVKGVTLMTLHISKGLEFNNVFITGLEEGLFPLSQNTDDSELEEERRLAYVGMTRAKKNLHLSYAVKRNKFGKIQYNQPSQFLLDLPKKFIHVNSLIRNSVFKKKKKSTAEHIVPKDSYYEMDEYSDNSHSKLYRVGRIVYHPRFGAGKIKKLEGKGDDLRISVIFGNNKIKKFIAKYAHLSL